MKIPEGLKDYLTGFFGALLVTTAGVGFFVVGYMALAKIVEALFG